MLMSSGRGTHWGAILFTIAAGSALFVFVVAPFVDDFLGGAEPPPVVRESPEPTETPLAVSTPLPEELGAELVSQSPAVAIAEGETVTVEVVLRNTGSAAWVRGAASEVRLGVVGEDERFFDLGMAAEWPLPTRAAVQSEAVVEPGDTGRFAFQITGTEAGDYVILLAPVVDGVAWMDLEITAEVTVG